MNIIEIKEELRVATFLAFQNLEQIESGSLLEHSLIPDLKSVLKSFEKDRNASGLFKQAQRAASKLESIQNDKPELVHDHLLASLKRAILHYAEASNIVIPSDEPVVHLKSA